MEIELLSGDVDKLAEVCGTVLENSESEVEVNPLEIPDESVEVDKIDELDELPGMIIT